MARCSPLQRAALAFSASRTVCTSSVPTDSRPAVNTIFVGNLPFSVTDDQLRDYFSEAGSVAHIRIAEDYATGRRKGYAHIEFVEVESASKALEFSGLELEGRALRIDLSAPRGAPSLLVLSYPGYSVALPVNAAHLACSACSYGA